jgi:hypothetical protein
MREVGSHGRRRRINRGGSGNPLGKDAHKLTSWLSPTYFSASFTLSKIQKRNGPFQGAHTADADDRYEASQER